jgi:hypothetical protein
MFAMRAQMDMFRQLYSRRFQLRRPLRETFANRALLTYLGTGGSIKGYAQRAWGGYLRQLDKRPIITKCWMSGLLLGAADGIGQLVQMKQHKNQQNHTESDSTPSFDFRRAAAVQVYAHLFQGPFGHWWYPVVHKMALRVAVLGSAGFLCVKVLADEIVNGGLTNTLYFSTIPLMEGWPVDKVAE